MNIDTTVEKKELSKYIIIFSILMCAYTCLAQKGNYKERQVCVSSEIHKGKANHGKPYCVGWATVREYKDGRKDTVAWWYSGKSFIGDEYEQYKKLTERGKYIVDSLKEDGIGQLQQSYLSYEPHYMKLGTKKEKFWSIIMDNVFIYEYLFWNKSRSNGLQLIKEYQVH